MGYTFEAFLIQSPIYRRSYEQLLAADRMLARSARTVFELHGTAVGAVAEPILAWTERHYGPDFIASYASRVKALASLQERFQQSPSHQTLGDPAAEVRREIYDITLLLSFIYSNHRFELLQAFKEFLTLIRKPGGRLASIGVGTGYELYVIANALRDWEVEGYDVNDEARRHAVSLLDHFDSRNGLQLHKEFPLDRIEPDFLGRYDAIVMCELLEHLPDPLGALKTARAYLAPNGRMFATMAINIAQEDHVFLYSTVDACRDQFREAGLAIEHEWQIPVVVHPSMRQSGRPLSRGNYAAMLSVRAA